MSKISLYIHSKDGKTYQANDVEEVYFTSKDVGDMGLLVGCDPVICLLETSHFFFKINDEKIYVATSGGLLDFNKNVCSLLLDTYEFKDEIDLSRAERKKNEALDILNNKAIKDDNMVKLASFSLKKAINRIALFK